MWTTVLSKAGNATVCGRVRVCVCVASAWRARECVRMQFYGNADPQNKVANEFAAPVLARSAIVL